MLFFFFLLPPKFHFGILLQLQEYYPFCDVIYSGLEDKKPQTSLGVALEGALTLAIAAAPAAASLAQPLASVCLILQSLFITVWIGTGEGTIGLCPKLQHFHLAGFKMCLWAPQELIAWRITVGHLAVLQVLEPHKIFGDELPGLPKDGVPPPSIYSTGETKNQSVEVSKVYCLL